MRLALIVAWVAGALGAMVLGTGPVHAEKRVALVIGNSTYRSTSRLENPQNDARLMAETLRDLGFALAGGGAQLDLDKAGIDRAVQAFGRELQGADVGLFYYAGHGVQVRGANYIVPVDANPAREADVDFQLLDANVVLRQMEAAGTHLNLILLDACRNNPFGASAFRDVSRGFAPMRAPEGTLISFATQPGNVAIDGSDGNSPYTKALATVMRRPGLDLFNMFNQVGLEVSRATAKAQLPWVSNSPISGTFYFAGPATQTAAVVPPVIPVRPDPAIGPCGGVTSVSLASRSAAPLSAGEECALTPKAVFRECAQCPDMVVVPAGSFTMGSPAGEEGREDNEGPQHFVTIGKPFAVGKFHVTIDQFVAFVEETGATIPSTCAASSDAASRSGAPRSWRNPRFFQQRVHPTVCLNWNDAVGYVSWLATKTGKKYRLLSEAEWEYSARANAGTRYSFGTDDGKLCRYANGADQTTKSVIAGTWLLAPCSDGFAFTAPVGSFEPNAFGLYDMHGNAWQLVEDCWHDDYRGSPTDGSPWISGDCSRRVLRGGSWNSGPANLRAAKRYALEADARLYSVGFRVGRTIAP